MDMAFTAVNVRRLTTTSLSIAFLLLWCGRVGGIATCDTLVDDCSDRVGPGSVCRADGKCTVPELEKGCLQALLPDWQRKRVCNSEDPPDAIERGLCEAPEFPYEEIRIYGGNWDSRAMQTWIAQIILSEVLGVPTSVEGGDPAATLNFYDSSMPLNYGANYYADNYGSVERGNSLRDCTAASRDPESYEGCAHLVLEVWNAGVAEFNEGVYNGLYEAPTSGGMLGLESVFVTKYTLENDTSLASYFGLQGDDKRQKLAEKFLRPTTWKDYCDQVSINNCTSDDGVAKRYPHSGAEEERMFMEGLFIGHFRATEENDCSLNNETFKCTGHIADFPCGWTSYLEAQMYHLGIPLQSSGKEPGSRGYSYQQQVDMWHAANATKSDLIMYWWSPQPLYQQFLGTEGELSKVTFPVPTQECLDNRVRGENMCVESKEVRVGNPLGACETPMTPLMKLFVSSLPDISNNPDDPPAIHSPAYEMLRLFQMSEFQLSEVFKFLDTEPSSRKAVCHWVVENMHHLQGFVPKSYPRVIEERSRHGWGYATTIIALCAAVLVCITVWRVHKERKEDAIRLAQIDFLLLLLAGSFLISIGAILTGMRPTNFTCSASIWFINIGYTLELVPLIVKVGAICRLTSASQRMERAVVSRQKLHGAVAIILFCVMIYLAIWTGIDHPEKQIEYVLSGEEKESGETVVTTSYYCSSESDAWEYVAVGWNLILLSVASVWAFQMRSTREILNETSTLAFMIYSHFMFVVLRVVTLVLSKNVEMNILMHTRSLIYSADTMATIIIYFIPKFAAAKTIKSNIRRRTEHFGHQFSYPHSTTNSRPSIMSRFIRSSFAGRKRGTVSTSLHLASLELPASLSSREETSKEMEPSDADATMGIRRHRSALSPTATINFDDQMCSPSIRFNSEIEEAAQTGDIMDELDYVPIIGSNAPATRKGRYGSAYVKVDKAGMVAVKDALVSMQEVHEEADAEIVVSRMMNFVVSFRAKQTDSSRDDTKERVGLLDTEVAARVLGEGDTQSEHTPDGEERVVNTSLHEDNGVLKKNVGQLTADDMKNDNATISVSSESHADDDDVYLEDAIINSVYYQTKKMQESYYDEENTNT